MSSTPLQTIGESVAAFQELFGADSRTVLVSGGAEVRCGAVQLTDAQIEKRLRDLGATIAMSMQMPSSVHGAADGLVVGGALRGATFTLRLSGNPGARDAEAFVAADGSDGEDGMTPEHYYRLIDAVLGKNPAPSLVAGYLAHRLHSGGKGARQLAAEASAIVTDWLRG